MSAAPSWPLVIVALLTGRHFRAAATAAPGLNFDPFQAPEDRISGPFGPDFVLQTLKTQNDARGDLIAPPVRIISLRLAKARNCLSPNDLRRNTRLSAARRAFVLPPRYGVTIMVIRGVNHRIPTHFRVRPASGHPFCRPAAEAGEPASAFFSRHRRA